MTATTSHTPGPWEWRKPYEGAGYYELVAVGDYGVHPNGEKVYPVIADDGSAGDEYGATICPDDPNAILIAAAPDLLAACKAAEEYVAISTSGMMEQVRQPLLAQIQSAIRRARAG